MHVDESLNNSDITDLVENAVQPVGTLSPEATQLFGSLEAVLGRAQAETSLARFGGRHTPQERCQAIINDLKSKLVELNTTDQSEKIFIPDWKNQPAHLPPTISWIGIPYLEVGNISMIVSAFGTGKSSICECHCSAAVDSSPIHDNLGITVNAPCVLYVDTERSESHSHESWRRFLHRLGKTAEDPVPEKILWRNIRGLSTHKERQSWLWTEIDKIPELSLIILDGISDFIGDVNDPIACPELISKLSAIVHNKHLACLATLHVNPLQNGSSESQKPRGVLGSELLRKCQGVAIIKKTDSDVRALTTQFLLGKNRAGSDQISIQFKWDPVKRLHVSCSDFQEVVPNKVIKERENYLKLMGASKWLYTDLVAAIMETGVSIATAKRKVTELIELKKIINEKGLYSVHKKEALESRAFDFEKEC